MNQLPITYPQAYPQQPSYSCNAVKIDIHNPQAGMPQQQMAAAPMTAPASNYNSIYNYPQNQIYAPAPFTAPAQIPAQFLPAPQIMPPTPAVYQAPAPKPIIINDTAQKIQPPVQQIATVVPPAPQQQQAPQQIINNNAPAPVAAPKDTMQSVEEKAVPTAVKAEDKPQTAEQKPEVNVQQSEEFSAKLRGDMLNRLTSQDAETQSKALIEIANATQQLAEAKKAISLKGAQDADKATMQAEYDKAFNNLAGVVLDEKVVESILAILVKDSTNLEGPTPQQIELRTKELNGQTLNETEKAEAEALSPFEKAEQNKEFALFTLRLIQEMYMEGIEKMTGKQPDLKDVPGVEQMVVTIKSNPNPAIRAAAISAMTHNSRPQDKEIVSTLLKIASEQDADEGVRTTAAQALGKLA